jgi:hypothetical protein
LTEVHPPHEPVRSVNDFVYHMLTIAVSSTTPEIS